MAGADYHRVERSPSSPRWRKPPPVPASARVTPAWLLSVSLSVLGAAHPPDPFASVYAPPRAEAVGTVAGQLHIRALAGGSLREGAQLVGQGTLEWMASSFVGTRLSSRTLLALDERDPQLWALVAGPSLHLLPYRPVDLALFADGGVTGVDLDDGSRTLMPVVDGGIGFEVALGSFWTLHFEGLLQWGIADRDGVARSYFQPVALGGLGLVL